MRPEVNLNFLGLLTFFLVILQCKVNTRIYNLTIFMSINDFIRPNVYDCYWTLFIFSVLLLSTDHYLQDSKKNERTARSHSRKGPGYEVLVAYTTCC